MVSLQSLLPSSGSLLNITGLEATKEGELPSPSQGEARGHASLAPLGQFCLSRVFMPTPSPDPSRYPLLSLPVMALRWDGGSCCTRALSCRLWDGIHRHCCEGQPGATEVPHLLHQVSESMASLCVRNRARSPPLQQRLHITSHDYTPQPTASHCTSSEMVSEQTKAGKEKRTSVNGDTGWAGSLGHISSPSAPLLPGTVPSSQQHQAMCHESPCTLQHHHPALSLQSTAGPRPGCHGDAAVPSYARWRDPHSSAFPFRDGVVTAAASLSCDPMVALIAEALYSGKQISKEEAE